MARYPKLQKHDFFFDVERGTNTVEYVCEFTVAPGQDETPRTMNGPGEPGYGPEVEDKTVYAVLRKPCPQHRFLWAGRDTCGECKTVREPRPELDGMVEDDELLEAAAEAAESEFYDRADYEWERRHDR